MALYVICPFYKYDKPTVLGCEYKMMKFSTYKDKKAWMMNQCCTFDYELCAFAQSLMKKYENEYKETQ